MVQAAECARSGVRKPFALLAPDQRQIRRWLRGETREAPLWFFVLEAAGNDPIRALEIEQQCLDPDTATERGAAWWARWWVVREERSRPKDAIPADETPADDGHEQFVIDEDGTLRRV